MGPIAYSKWEKAIEQGNFKVAGSIAHTKSFLFYLLDQLDPKNEEDQPAFRLCIEKLQAFPLNIWEQLEVALYGTKSDATQRLVDEAFSGLVGGVRDRNDGRTLVHVHVPKAAGTSLNVALKNHFYQENVSLPGNNTPNAMRLVFQQLLGQVPYLTTGHVPLDWLLNEDRFSSDLCRPFMVLRNRAERINSMRNQLLLALASGRFFNRPYAYRERVSLGSFCNRYLFPVTQERLTNSNAASLAQDLRDARNVLNSSSVAVIRLPELSQYFINRFGLAIERVRKNRTHNVSALLPAIPEIFSRYDQDLFT